MIPKVLSIAGSDPSGGAGIQADLKTFSALGVYGMAVPTSLTAQNTKGVYALEVLSPEFVREQLRAIFDDITVDGVKIGMIGDAHVANVIADVLEQFKPRNIVLDPVMVATSGDSLIAADAMDVLKARLIPLSDIVTPNIPEAEKLTRKSVLDVAAAGHDVLALGAKAVLMKGGHFVNEDHSDDVFISKNEVYIHDTKRILTTNTHGTGCTLSSAIATFMAHGMNARRACAAAKDYVTGAIKNADTLGVGHGHGPVHHFWDLWESKDEA